MRCTLQFPRTRSTHESSGNHRSSDNSHRSKTARRHFGIATSIRGCIPAFSEHATWQRQLFRQRAGRWGNCLSVSRNLNHLGTHSQLWVALAHRALFGGPPWFVLVHILNGLSPRRENRQTEMEEKSFKDLSYPPINSVQIQ